MRRTNNYVMLKRARPKQVTLPDGRTFVAMKMIFLERKR